MFTSTKLYHMADCLEKAAKECAKKISNPCLHEGGVAFMTMSHKMRVFAGNFLDFEEEIQRLPKKEVIAMTAILARCLQKDDAN